MEDTRHDHWEDLKMRTTARRLAMIGIAASLLLAAVPANAQQFIM
jgi:hypothetical protein